MNTYKKLGNNRTVNSCVFQSFGHWSPVKYKFYTMIQYTHKYPLCWNKSYGFNLCHLVCCDSFYFISLFPISFWSSGRRSLVGCSPWGREESDTTERLHFHVSLSCIGEGSGNPLPCSCLENPRDGGAGWAAIYGVAQSQTRLKRLRSSSSSSI